MHKFVVAAALSFSLMLSGCEDPAYFPSEVPQAVEGVIPGIEVSNARLVLAPVEGNPAAIYFDISYSGDERMMLRAAEVDGVEEVKMHATRTYGDQVVMRDAGIVPLGKGETVSFEPGGRHVMVMNPSSDLKPGGSVEVSLTVAGGHKHRFNADIRAAGEER